MTLITSDYYLLSKSPDPPSRALAFWLRGLRVGLCGCWASWLGCRRVQDLEFGVVEFRIVGFRGLGFRVYKVLGLNGI